LVTALEVLIWLIDDRDLWFDSESHRAKNKPHLHRANSNNTAWLVTAPWEQLALETDNWFHDLLLSLVELLATDHVSPETDIPPGVQSPLTTLMAFYSAAPAGPVVPFCLRLWVLKEQVSATCSSATAVGIGLSSYMSPEV
jgi:hypothetical protein